MLSWFRWIGRVLRLINATDLFALSFAATIIAGTFALMVPASTRSGEIRFIDALFTATSAVCVTGLTVVDTGTYFTRLGQTIILFLIQIGGLGIMSFSVVLLLFAGRRISIRDKILVQDVFAPWASGEIYSLVRRLFATTFIIEGLGAFCLWVFTPEHKVFPSVFHAVSAFCNAGFSTYQDSFVRFRNNIPINLIMCALIILGGLGFFTLIELGDWRRRGRTRFRYSLHSRLVLTITWILILVGGVGFYAFESRNTLRGVSALDAALSSLFQSVTTRTAGFNTINIGALTNASLFMVILLMFIGASPGSTGGGVKTSTVGVLWSLAASRFRGEEQANVFRRTVPQSIVAKALAVLVLAFSLVTVATLVLAFVEIGSAPYLHSDERFIAIFFEIVSAFGTVGLSTGITSTLSVVGKVIVILVMFIGRVGPLTIATVAGRRATRGKYRYAEENVMVG